jgi:hypothetical protein
MIIIVMVRNATEIGGGLKTRLLNRLTQNDNKYKMG